MRLWNILRASAIAAGLLALRLIPLAKTESVSLCILYHLTGRRCPGCGMPYNGRKCRNCLFQPAKTDLTAVRTGRKRNHASPGFPKCGKKQKSLLRSLIGFLVILALIALMLPSLRNWGMELEEMERTNSTVQSAAD